MGLPRGPRDGRAFSVGTGLRLSSWSDWAMGLGKKLRGQVPLCPFASQLGSSRALLALTPPHRLSGGSPVVTVCLPSWL